MPLNCRICNQASCLRNFYYANSNNNYTINKHNCRLTLKQYANLNLGCLLTCDDVLLGILGVS